MDGLLIALLCCFLGEMGDKGQKLTLALVDRFDRNGPIIAGLVVAMTANAAISVAAGMFLGPMMGGNARLLFFAMALLFLGVGMFWPVKAPDPLDDWRLGPFLNSALGLFILGFGNGTQFLILGLAVRSPDPWLVGIGGAAGCIAALIPVVAGRGLLMAQIPFRAIRVGGGAIFTIAAILMALSALGRL